MEHRDAEQIVARVARNTRLQEGPEGVRRFLFRLHQEGRSTSRDLAQRISLPLPVVAAIRREMEKEGLLIRDAGIRLSPQGAVLVDVLGLGIPHVTLTCENCLGTGVRLPDAWQPLIDDLRPAFERRPTADMALDQSHGTLETAFRRAGYLLSQGLLVGRRILILGDDDFTSLACAALVRHVAPVHFPLLRLQVIEIDTRYLDVLREESENRGLGILCDAYDARDPLPDRFHRRHDVFLTDPPYTLEGATLFLSRGLHGLDRSETRDVLLSYPSRSPMQNWEMQDAMLELGLSLRQVFPGFNEYHGGAMHANVSTLYHLQVTPGASPLHQGKWPRPIYTGEDRPASIYRCKSCGHTLSVGRGGEYAGMVELKAGGCPECGQVIFQRVGKA